MDIDNMLKDNTFFAEELEYFPPDEEICQEELDELDDFPGKEAFLRFYGAHNGVGFPMGAWFFPDEYYHVSIGLGSNPHVDIEQFLTISDMEKWKDIILINHGYYEDFMVFHIPFALDVRSNLFWIDIQSGEIKYTDFETCFDPENEAVTVAFSFENFCKRIRKNKWTMEDVHNWFTNNY